MAKTLDELKAEVLALPVGERVEVALALIHSVDDFESEAETWKELKETLALIDSGKMEFIDEEEVEAEFRARYRCDESATRR